MRRANGERGYRKAGPVPNAPAEQDCSWLGRWSDVGWAIRIEPRLTKEQWGQYSARSSEGWDETVRRYDPLKTMEVLLSLFPTHSFAVMWPRCGKRIVVSRRDKLPVYLECGEVAKHSETHLKDVHGTRTAIARCDKHRGQL